LTGFGFGKILASLAPQDPRTKDNPIPDMEASLQRKEGRLVVLLEKFGDDTNPTIQAAVEAQIVKLGGDIESDKAKLQKTRSEWRGEALNDDASFLKRLREAHLRLDSDDPTIRYQARAKLSNELRSKIAVTLHHDRVIAITVNRSARQVEEPRQQIEITLRPDQPPTIRYPSDSSKQITDIWEHAGDNEEQIALSVNALRQARMARMARRVAAAKNASD
jgi:hypothetical protein